jgi:hypothetical protein
MAVAASEQAEIKEYFLQSHSIAIVLRRVEQAMQAVLLPDAKPHHSSHNGDDHNLREQRSASGVARWTKQAEHDNQCDSYPAANTSTDHGSQGNAARTTLKQLGSTACTCTNTCRPEPPIDCPCDLYVQEAAKRHLSRDDAMNLRGGIDQSNYGM